MTNMKSMNKAEQLHLNAMHVAYHVGTIDDAAKESAKITKEIAIDFAKYCHNNGIAFHTYKAYESLFEEFLIIWFKS